MTHLTCTTLLGIVSGNDKVVGQEGPCSRWDPRGYHGDQPHRGAGVKFGSTKRRATKFTQLRSITARSPAGTSGAVDVTVTTPNGSSEITSKDRFTYEAPTVTNVSPNRGSKAGGTAVAITGSGLAIGSGTTVFEFGNALATAVTCSSPTECTMLTPATAGSGTVEVRANVGGKTGERTRLPMSTHTTDGRAATDFGVGVGAGTWYLRGRAWGRAARHTRRCVRIDTVWIDVT